MRAMNDQLSKFAKKCGVRIVRCKSSEWGGSYGYVADDAPDCHYLGYENKQAAYLRWMEDSFGPRAGKALMELLSKESR